MAKNDTVLDLQKIERAVLKFIKKTTPIRADIDYKVQAEIDSTKPHSLHYGVSITSPAKGLQPIAFLSDSLDDIIEQIKLSTEHLDYDAIEIAYHKAQIIACDSTKLGHEERIKEIEESKKDEQSEQ